MESRDEEISSWLEREVAGCQDVRYGKRFRTLLGQLSEQIYGSIPFACQDWDATKPAYQFLSNKRISEEQILAGHFCRMRERTTAAHARPVLVLHDTTEFIYRREEPHAIGNSPSAADALRQPSSLPYDLWRADALKSGRFTKEGLPLGLAPIKIWTRDKFHGAKALNAGSILLGFPSNRRRAIVGSRT